MRKGSLEFGLEECGGQGLTGLGRAMLLRSVLVSSIEM